MEFFLLLFWIINGDKNSWIHIKNFFRNSSTSSSCFQTKLETVAITRPPSLIYGHNNNGQLILFVICSFVLLYTSSSTRHKLIASISFHTQIVSDPYDIKMADPYAGENVADYDM